MRGRIKMKGMSKRAMSAALSLVMGITTTAALPVSAMAEEKEYTAKELHVAIWDNNQLDGLQKIADEWTEKSGIPVNIDVITWNEYWTLLEAGAMGGELPDVFWMHINEAQKYMEAEVLLNLNDYIEADDAIDLSNYYEGIVDIYRNNDIRCGLPYR